MPRRTLPVATLGLLGAAIFAAPRQARAEDSSRTAADDVLVRGIGRDAGGFVSEAHLEDATRDVTDAASLVEPLPGVHVRRLGADDSFATMSIRGTSSSEVAIYLAGVPLSGGADPTLDLATLPLWPGARARVYRSFSPAAIGRGSLGGTFVLDPPSPRGPERTEIWGAIGSYGSARLRIGDVRTDGDTRIVTALSASRSDGDFTYLDPAASFAAGSDVFVRRANAGHAGVNGLVSVVLPVRFAGKEGALSVTGLAQARRQELPGTVYLPTPNQRLDSNRVLSALELSTPAGSGAFSVRGWGRREGLSITDAKSSAEVTLTPSSTADAILAAGGSAGWRGRPGEDVLVEARLDGSAERFLPGTWVGALAPPDARRANGGAAIDATFEGLAPLVITTSGRIDAWADDATGTTRGFVRPNGHLGIERAFGAVVLAAHGGVLARPPSFVERYGNRGAFLGSPTLRPETAETIDLGGELVDRRLGPLRFGLSAATFATWADDLIVYVNQGAYGRALATNIGQARLFGVEAEAHASAYGFGLRVSNTSLATRNESACAALVGDCERPPLPGRPEEDFVGDLTFTRGALRLRYGVDVVTGITADVTGITAVPDRVLQSAGIRFDIPAVPGLSFTLDVRNLFDARVATYAGAVGSVRAPIGDLYEYPLPGRNVLFAARYATDVTDRVTRIPEPEASSAPSSVLASRTSK